MSAFLVLVLCSCLFVLCCIKLLYLEESFVSILFYTFFVRIF